ncbi:hypothetical protein FQN54_000087 [Arachnomyces sp. PD_36]|nr:hypothetical protein FQN54_000087 [Arachnomyces sp. PD_36]
MKSHAIATRATTLLLLAASVAEAGHHGHSYPHNRQHLPHHHHGHRSAAETEEADVEIDLEKRGGQCQFPTDAGLVAVTPDLQNAGWAMSPDQPCTPGHYCPYACPPGQVSMQWDPEATSYAYPMSMNGGLYCDESGQVSKPFPDQPYCADGVGSIGAKNSASGHVAFCQTVLPGNEAMLIPTSVDSWAQLAVPDPSYWCETAAHYYINPPGVDCDTACVWGTNANPWGNWSPYVAGANADSSGMTYLKLGWNPIYLEPTTPFRQETPSFGVEIVCNGDCVGLPCKIDPAVNGVNEMVGAATDGAGGGAFCVVTVPPGSSADIVVFDGSGGNGGDDGGDDTPTTTEAPPPPPTTTSTTPTPEPTTEEPEPEPTTTSETSTYTPAPSSSEYPSSSWGPSYSASISSSAQYTYAPHMFMEESGITVPSGSPSSTSSPATPTQTGASSTLVASTMSLTLSFLLAAIALQF